MLLAEIVGPDVATLKAHLENLFASHGIAVEPIFTKHFIERLSGRENTVTPEAIYNAFSKALCTHKEHILDNLQSQDFARGIVKDASSNLTIVFNLKKPLGRMRMNKYNLYCITLKSGDVNQFGQRPSSSEEALAVEAVDDIVDVGSYVPLPKPGKKRKGKGKLTEPTTDRAMNSIINTQWFYQNSDAS